MLKTSGAAAAAMATGMAGRTAFAREKPESLGPSYIYYCPELVEVTSPRPVVGPDGTAGCWWARKPLFDLNFEDARFFPVKYFQRFRMKKWDMYHVTTPSYYLQFLVAWIGYGAFCSVLAYDREARTFADNMHIRLPRPELRMMRDSTGGVTEYVCKKMECRFEVEGASHRIRFDSEDMGYHFEAELYHPPERDSICAVHLTNPRRMHYGRKINTMPATGKMTLGGRSFELDPETSMGALDFGRGYYPPRLFWYWATASGRDERGKLLGWNLGHGNSPEGMAENAVFYDGRLHKIGVTRCQAPDDPDAPWKVWTEDGGLELTFTPEKVRDNRLELGFLYTVGRVALGRYSGKLTLDTGRVITVKDVFGLYEWTDQKW